MRPQKKQRSSDEGGWSLIEVVVGMTILVVFFAIFGGSMISAFNSVNATTQNAYAQSTTNTVYVTLEAQIRYASGLSQPASNVFQTGDAVVEFLTEYTGTATCTELRLSPTGQLQERSWGQNASPIVMTATKTLAINVGADTPTNAASATTLVAGPFAVMLASGSLSSQRLEVAVNVQDNRNTTTQTRIRHLDVSFTAQNTSTSTSSNSVCSAGRSVTWPTG